MRYWIDLIENIENHDRTFFHVTLTENLDDIMAKGLVPTVGDRSKKLNEPAAVFMFDTEQSAEQAVEQWLGPEMEDEDGEQPDLALLKITLPAEIEVFQTEGFEIEFYTRERIPPQCISIVSRVFN